MATSTMNSLNAARYQGTASRSDIVRQVFVILALLGTIYVNYLSNALPLNGRSAGEISDSFPTRFTPAGYVFAIWSVIYLGLIIFAIWQALPGQQSNPRLRAIFWPFVLSCMTNVTWLLSWHYGYYPLPVLIMLTFLGALIVLYATLYPTYATVSWAERWTTHIPFRIYLGWITVATIANITITLYNFGWRDAPFGAPTWAAIMIVVATVVGLFFALRLRDAAYTLVLVWAFYGIYIKQADAPITAYTAVAMAALLGVAALYALVRSMMAPKAVNSLPG